MNTHLIDYAFKSKSNTSFTNQYLGIRHSNLVQTHEITVTHAITMVCDEIHLKVGSKLILFIYTTW